MKNPEPRIGQATSPPSSTPGILIISLYYIVTGSNGLYQLANDWLHGQYFDYAFILIPVSFLISGIGLYLHKGWGRNLAISLNFYPVYLSLHWILSYYLINHDFRYLLKGVFDFLIAAVIFFYLFRKSVRDVFSDSPVSLIFLGFILSSYGITQHSSNALIDYFWLAMAIVGFALMIRSAKQFRGKIW